MGGAGGSGIVVARAPTSAGIVLGGNPGCAAEVVGENIIKFTSSGNLTVLDSGCGVSANYLVVAGGGGGGTYAGGG
jgi:hypothetical protein